MKYAVRIILLLVALLINMPLLWTVLASVGVIPNNANRPPSWLWPPTDENYLDVIADPNMLRELATSIGIAVTTTLVTVFVSFLAAYSIARAAFRGKMLVLQVCLVLSSFPVISYVIPLRAMLLIARLYDTLPGIILAESALYASLAVYVLHGYLAHLSREVEDAARIDSANLTQVLRLVVAPAIAPGLSAVAILIFTLSWNHTLLPMVITARNVQTIPVMLNNFFTYERELDWQTAAAALMVSLIPLLVFVAAAHRALEHFSLNIGQDTAA